MKGWRNAGSNQGGRLNTALVGDADVALLSRDRGPWIQTYTGRRFHYADPQPEDIHVADIAQALSQLCRYAGHTRLFYSVAEHSVILARQFDDPLLRMIGLLHDATEAYCVDIPRPLKRMLPEYTAYEEGLWRVVADKFGLPSEIPQEIHDMDTRMLITERPFLFNKPLPWPMYEHVKPIDGVTIECLPPTAARSDFLATFIETKHLLAI